MENTSEVTTDGEYTQIIDNQAEIIDRLDVQNNFLGGLFFGMILLLSFMLAFRFGKWIYSLIRL